MKIMATNRSSDADKSIKAARFLRSASKAGRPDDEAERERQEEIALAAYYRAEARGFAPDYEKEDWLQAIQDVEKAGD